MTKKNLSRPKTRTLPHFLIMHAYVIFDSQESSLRKSDLNLPKLLETNRAIVF